VTSLQLQEASPTCHSQSRLALASRSLAQLSQSSTHPDLFATASPKAQNSRWRHNQRFEKHPRLRLARSGTDEAVVAIL
jgi:hypothetical protein